jgi:hypothetical protein
MEAGPLFPNSRQNPHSHGSAAEGAEEAGRKTGFPGSGLRHLIGPRGLIYCRASMVRKMSAVCSACRDRLKKGHSTCYESSAPPLPYSLLP